ncbi:MAG: flagellar basal body-associated FliL family protein [Desulfobacterales bacterium]|nr:flagellar basal body-associated FliL family protein [Desulfobacterales bacterium]
MGPDDKVEDAEAALDHASLLDAVEWEHGSEKQWRPKKHRRAIRVLLVAVCLLFVVYGLMWFSTGRREMTSGRVYRAPIWNVETVENVENVEKAKNLEEYKFDIIDFARFVVLLPEENNKAYLLLRISVQVSNSKVYEEINEKRASFRGAIYGVLNKVVKANNKQEIHKKELKQDIMDALNGIVGAGGVISIGFTEFLLV